MRRSISAYEIEEHQRKSQEKPSTTAKYKAHANHLLTVQILVQNRSESKEPVMVFAARTVVHCIAEHTDKVMFGYLGSVDHCLHNDRWAIPCFGRTLLVLLLSKSRLVHSTRIARCGPAHDPFTNRPRLFIKNFNGHEVGVSPLVARAATDPHCV